MALVASWRTTAEAETLRKQVGAVVTAVEDPMFQVPSLHKSLFPFRATRVKYADDAPAPAD